MESTTLESYLNAASVDLVEQEPVLYPVKNIALQKCKSVIYVSVFFEDIFCYIVKCLDIELILSR